MSPYPLFQTLVCFDICRLPQRPSLSKRGAGGSNPPWCFWGDENGGTERANKRRPGSSPVLTRQSPFLQNTSIRRECFGKERKLLFSPPFLPSPQFSFTFGANAGSGTTVQTVEGAHRFIDRVGRQQRATATRAIRPLATR